MYLPIHLFIGLSAYALSIVILWKNSHRGAQSTSTDPEVKFIALSLIAVVIHGSILYRNLLGYGNGDAIMLSLGTGISVAGWISGLIFSLVSIRKSIASAGLIILPMAMLALLAGEFIPGDRISLNTLPIGIILHVLLAIPAYGFLCLAFAQACLLIIQERQLQSPGSKGLFTALPAIQTMEHYLFLFTLSGFILMTVNLALGMTINLFYQDKLLTFNHHILLSIIAWAWFGSLLLGRKIAGWRGKAAAKWTIGAFIVFLLAYFGTRFVNQFILIEKI